MPSIVTHCRPADDLGAQTFLRELRLRGDGTVAETRVLHRPSDPKRSAQRPVARRRDGALGFFELPTGYSTDLHAGEVTWCVRAANGSVRRHVRPAGWMAMGHPEWSPGGSRLAIAVAHPWEPDYRTVTCSPALRDIATIGYGPTGQPLCGWVEPSWTPGGRLLGARKVRVGAFDSPTLIETVDMSRTPKWGPIDDEGAHVFDPYMSPDRTRVVWLRRDSVNGLRVATVDERKPRWVIRAAAWGWQSHARWFDDRWLLTTQKVDALNYRVALVDVDTGTVRSVTDPHKPEPDGRRYSDEQPDRLT